MTEDRKAKMLERVRALLAKADSTKFPAEADAFRAKADEIMEAYAIEQWMVTAAQDSLTARPKPEIRAVNFDWWYKSSFASELYTIFLEAAHHCRCVVATRGRGKDGFGSYEHMPVIGLPSDLDYFDLLFTHLMLQMGKQLDPKPDPNLSAAENGYKLRSAGLDWMKTVRLMWKAGLLDPPRGRAGMKVYYSRNVEESLAEDPTLMVVDRSEFSTGGYVGRKITPEWIWEDLPEETRTAIKNRLAQQVRNYRREHKLEDYTATTPKVYRRSFAYGFTEGVRRHFREMRSASEGRNTGSNALALRDIRTMALELYEEKWPPPPPVEIDPNAKPRRRSTAVAREVRYDYSVINRGTAAGRAAAAKAPGKSGGGLRQTPELPGS